MQHDGGSLVAPSGIRLVALDIDDTLIPWPGTLSQQTADAVRAARAAGVEIVLATGRGVSDVVPLAQQLGLDEVWALCSNGSLTARIVGGEFTIERTVTFDARPIVAALRELDPGAPIAIEQSGLGFLTDGRTFGGQAARIIGPIGEFPEAVTFLSIASAMLTVDQMASVTDGHEVHAIPYPRPEWVTVDVVHADAGKGTALAALAAQLGVAASECAAMGDYINDIPMLEWAGWAVAMGQAPDAVKAVADAVAPAAVDHGAAVALLALVASAQ